MKELTFYYDVVCPFAYAASCLIEALAERNGAKIRWTPVLLGGLYQGNQSASPMTTSGDAKKKYILEDIRRMFHRYSIPVHVPSFHPIKSVTPMRLLAATPITSSNLHEKLAHALFKSYWIEHKDVTSIEVLRDIVNGIGWNVDVEDIVKTKGKENLIQNTQEALNNGAFGVPSFVVNGQLYFGVDTMHFLERELGSVDASPLRRLESPLPTSPKFVTLTIYHDFASPWSFIGSTQIKNLVDKVKPTMVKVEWIPIVLGALFKQVGTPTVPLNHVSPAKRMYLFKTLLDWCKYAGVEEFGMPSHFPLRTIRPLRLILANNEEDDKLQNIIYRAAWVEDKDIGNEEVLKDILVANGYDAKELMRKSVTQEIKDQLRKNTDRAEKAGVFGVPSYQVNGGPVIWGQDRLNVVADILCGWKDPIQSDMSKL